VSLKKVKSKLTCKIYFGSTHKSSHRYIANLINEEFSRRKYVLKDFKNKRGKRVEYFAKYKSVIDVDAWSERESLRVTFTKVE
ncbi:MAG: hypothetical protein AAF429_15015, partial [Pseudomonadota bacterium]